MGNSNGAMHWYTEYAYEEPLYQGGFIWDYIDQSIRTKDRYGNTTYAYGGDFDDRPCDYNFCGNGIAYGDGEESPEDAGGQIQLSGYLRQGDGYEGRRHQPRDVHQHERV